MILLAILRILVGALLTVSAYGKARQRYALAVRDVSAYRIAGPRTAEAVAVLLPSIEMFLGGCLVLGAGLPVAEVCAAALFLGFAVVAFSALRRGIVTECGCFGSIARQKVGVPLLVRNLVIAVVLVADGLAGPPQLVWIQNQAVVLIGLGAVTFLGVLLRLSDRATEHRQAVHATL